ncbi:hypothetical protein BT69DRAFT_1289439 [Atractiella rhizophila]|nr:hypothetical protein BT69DRAFT_1289439 [Atractiella rhizophila]
MNSQALTRFPSLYSYSPDDAIFQNITSLQREIGMGVDGLEEKLTTIGTTNTEGLDWESLRGAAWMPTTLPHLNCSQLLKSLDTPDANTGMEGSGLGRSAILGQIGTDVDGRQSRLAVREDERWSPARSSASPLYHSTPTFHISASASPPSPFLPATPSPPTLEITISKESVESELIPTVPCTPEPASSFTSSSCSMGSQSPGSYEVPDSEEESMQTSPAILQGCWKPQPNRVPSLPSGNGSGNLFRSHSKQSFSLIPSSLHVAAIRLENLKSRDVALPNAHFADGMYHHFRKILPAVRSWLRGCWLPAEEYETEGEIEVHQNARWWACRAFHFTISDITRDLDQNASKARVEAWWSAEAEEKEKVEKEKASKQRRWDLWGLALAAIAISVKFHRDFTKPLFVLRVSVLLEQSNLPFTPALLDKYERLLLHSPSIQFKLHFPTPFDYLEEIANALPFFRKQASSSRGTKGWENIFNLWTDAVMETCSCNKFIFFSAAQICAASLLWALPQYLSEEADESWLNWWEIWGHNGTLRRELLRVVLLKPEQLDTAEMWISGLMEECSEGESDEEMV